MRSLAILGASGLARQIAWVVRRSNSFQVVAFVDETISATSSIAGTPVYQSVSDLSAQNADVSLLSAVGDPELRRRWSREHGTQFSFATIVDPAAILADDSFIGAGSVIHAGSILSTEASVGDHSILGFNVAVSHEALVGSFTHIAGGAILNGRARIGNGCRIGAGATILPDIEIGDDAVVGAGSLVTKHVAAGTTVAGVPARKLTKRHS